VCSLASHSSRVTCLALCQEQGVAVSGSKDRFAILWDMDKKRYVRRLGDAHPGPLRQVSVNRSNANVLTFAETVVSYFHVNGELLARVDLVGVHGGVQLKLPETVLVTSCDDYQDGILLVSGHKAGQVALWDLPEGPGVRTFSLRATLGTGQNASVVALCTDAGQRRLAAGDDRGNVSLWASYETSNAAPKTPFYA